MKYVIYGGNGFVGSHLVENLHSKDQEIVVCDINPDIDKKINGKCKYIIADIRDIDSLKSIPIEQDDVVINLAANQYHQRVPKDAYHYFFDTNTLGTKNILDDMISKSAHNFLMFTTDMVYGRPKEIPVKTTHPMDPFGYYGLSKKKAEEICSSFRNEGMNITLMRPRMICGPGRLGILTKLFKFMDLNLPVPTIGNGENHYQMISVFDCVSAIEAAICNNLPNKAYNLGSLNPPCVRELLKSTIEYAQSHSFVIPTPGKLVKAALACLEYIDLPIMYREQYMIADEEYLLDISETVSDLKWQPKYNDQDMLIAAYQEFENMKN